LGYARFKSNSVLLPIVMHSFVNLLATIQAAIW
jgi:membrane protease YdiL (CAAX protease family)